MVAETKSTLLEIVYSSETPVPMPSSDVAKLLDHARDYNTEHNVTGLLCYDGKQFLQIIEGETDVIMDLFHAIQSDTRHTNVRILHEGDIDSRAFNDWQMAYEAIPLGLIPTLARAIHKRASGSDLDDNMSAGRRVFTLFMDETYKEDLVRQTENA